MQAALSLAKVAADKGDVPVGAIVVNESGEILGTGQNLREQNNDPTAHAEIVALRNASEKFGSWRLDDLTIVVTLEPCAMCAGAILQSRIKRLVFAAWDEKAGAVGSVMDVIRDPRALTKVEVITGIMEKECSDVLKDFFNTKR
ncbi:MAG: tRNA adenosine(34) deaminase TadA [Actinobacteria bacterium]|jgi:tRNA(adenine34) deaminase|nr:tRNA adenosine(34) deaminase TadA [Actinomycetota bacterium]